MKRRVKLQLHSDPNGLLNEADLSDNVTLGQPPHLPVADRVSMTDTKRQAHRKVVEMVFKSSKTEETADHKKPIAVIGSLWRARKPV